MKKTAHFCISVFCCLLVLSCSKRDDDIYSKSFNERYESIKKDYVKVLTSPKHGWVGTYSPNSKKLRSYKVFLDFIDDKNVVVQSEYNNGRNNDIITYRIDRKVDLEIVFESHTVFHKMYELDFNRVGGEYVFKFVTVKDDMFEIVSATDDGYNDEEITTLKLHKMNTEEERNAWEKDTSSAMRDFSQYLVNGSVWKTIKKDGKPIASIYGYGVITISYYDANGIFRVKGAQISFTPDGPCFSPPLVIGDTSIECFSYNAEQDKYTDPISQTELSKDTTPLIKTDYYTFGERDMVAYNDGFYGDYARSSQSFKNIIAQTNEALMKNTEVERINYFSMENLTGSEEEYSPWFLIRLSNEEEIWFYFEYVTEKDPNDQFFKVYITLGGGTNCPEEYKPYLQPLVNFFSTPSGFYTRYFGKLFSVESEEDSIDKNFELISVDDPAYSAAFLESY